MTIYTRKPVLSAINVVPMLDILTILLIFFIVHTELKRQVNVLPLDLPETHALAGENGRTDDILLEVGADGAVALAGREIASAELADAARSLRSERPEAKLQVSAAQGASMGRFIEVMDVLAEAGWQPDDVPVRIEYKPSEQK